MFDDCGIYCYENLLNGKKYIGQSKELSRRYVIHERNFKNDVWNKRENKLLWYAIKKYGRNNFRYSVLKLCEESKLDELEIWYIKNWNTHFSGNGYNISWGGGTTKGVVPSEDARRNMSLSHKGKKQSKELVEKRMKFSIGRKRKNSSSEFIGVHLTLRGKRNIGWLM